MSGRVKIKILVQSSKSCTKLLRYIDRNASRIRNLGVSIRIEKLSRDDCGAETILKLQKKGIARLPALITPDGMSFIGIEAIVKLLETNFKSKVIDQKISVDYNDVREFMTREIMGGLDEDGRPKNDREDLDDDNNVDFAAKMAEYTRNAPKHRRPDREKNIETAARPSRNTGGNNANNANNGGNNYINDDPDDYDNIDMGENTPNVPINTEFGDDVDRRMFAAWANNLG